MRDSSPPAAHLRLIQWASSRRNLRLASGLVLFTYVSLHLTCHALGLVSLDAAEAGLRATVRLWHSGPGTVLLYGAAALHIGLALLAIYDRRTLRMAPLNAIRIALGVVMPLSLIGHFVGTRYAFEHLGLASEYSRVAGNLWIGGAKGLTLGLLAPGWVHGCLGLRFAFGHRILWQRLRLELFGAALLIPVLAGLGFVSMGRGLAARESVIERQPAANTTQRADLQAMRDGALATYLALIGLIVVGRLLRSVNERRRKSVVHISYPGRSVTVPRGWSVLEASRSFGIAHPSMCGGRARCSTCRVRVVDGGTHCPPAQIDERRTLDGIAAPAMVRLACQLRPTGDISVEIVLRIEDASWIAAPPRIPPIEGEVAVLFFNLVFKAAPTRSEASAHDTMYALGRFQDTIAAVLEAAAGVILPRSGDSWMALFGLKSDVREGARQALEAARRIEQQATALRERLFHDLGLLADFSVGVNTGAVVAGMIGDGEASTLAAVGEAIDASARLQQFAANRSAHFVISRQAANAAGIDDPALDWHPVGIDAGGASMLCAEASAMAPAVC